MKHSLSTTLILLLFFVLAQLIGLGLLAVDADVVTEGNQTRVVHGDTAIGPRPDYTPTITLISLIIALGIGTGLVLLLIKFKVVKVWKAWFFLAITLALTVAFGVFLPTIAALILGAVLTFWKMFYPGTFIHNFTELLIYPGLALLFVPLLSIPVMLILLVLIALYDAYAVWKSKHMITMAEFQTEAKTFAGLSFPVHKGKQTKSKKTKKGKKAAILGGGDIAFPLLFIGVIFESLLTKGLLHAFLLTLIPLATATLALAYIFFKGESNKYYPAMPFLTGGCVFGYLILLVL